MLIACSSGAQAGGTSVGTTGGTVAPLCAGTELAATHPLNLAQPADFVGFMDGVNQHAAADSVWLDSTGTACATALDKAACAAKVHDARIAYDHALGNGNGSTFYRLIITRGDAVEVIGNDNLLDTIGAVDTSSEAVLYLISQGYSFDCHAEDKALPSVATGATGIEITTRYLNGICDPKGGLERRHVSVHPDATIEILDKTLISPGSPGSCG